MSEVKLNLIDTQQVLHGTIHGSVADACVAALSAEPETIAELTAALSRYIKPLDDRSPFASFHSSVNSSAQQSIDTKPWDAGIVVIDLAARIVACESTYSMPGPSGEVRYHDGTKSTDISVFYRLPDDWLFVNSVEAYQWSRERRARERLADTPLDVREVLYGIPLLDFIVTECGKIEGVEARPSGTGPISVAPDAAGSIADDADLSEDPMSKEVSRIHSRWLMTPREDLRGQSPRDVILVKQEVIDFDLHTRSLQWSDLDEGPPCLSPDSYAYRFAGFGTHEWVIYYDLVRHLLWSALKLWSALTCRRFGLPDPSPHTHNEKFLTQLEELERNWLEQPWPDYDGRIPAILIDNERRRLPIALRPRDMIVDEDCPMCQMFGDETSPLGMGVGFWHLDGCNMDDDFAFSSYRTREEWEAENLRREEFNKEFDLRWEERQQRIARGETLEFDPYLDPEPFPELENEDAALLSAESLNDDETELPQ
jgi:hypothetical protein